jgi:thiosulfate/3-mercaptopyruvate sulfurtransferase
MQFSDAEDALEDLPPSAKFIFKELTREGPMTLKGITETTLLGSRTARYGLEKLQEAELVESSPAIHDGRQTCYSIRARSMGDDRTGYPCTGHGSAANRSGPGRHRVADHHVS